MTEKLSAMVLASFAADSLALGAHWIYDTGEIDGQIGRVDQLLKPPANTFHPSKQKGEFTHYGDQTMVLLESLATSRGFTLESFSGSWREFFEGYDGYFDHATKETLESFDAGKGPDKSGSTSTDLGGAARIAPLVYRYADDLDVLIDSAKAQTAMTHNHSQVIRSAEFLARVTWQVLRGSTPTAAIDTVTREGFKRGDFGAFVSRGLDSASKDTRQAILEFGQHCGTPAALPAVIHLMVRYEDDLQTALVENVMAGGDSAARGMVVGMILGAHLGTGAIPESWLSDLSHRERIEAHLKQIDTP
ncbi:ADP-ribosylglycohydrolase family protein [Olavius algarvensis associated proteobacterium Delta 3]|nr:ADP-ribosylglycohydrolase family protein [Olavius algarvensis associated proteobacterium Delta 3]CAB5097993.1 ADP-ribosylglycohydrolase family protein [Olavius algarvensis associated proteobacterium Delta 3]